MNARAASMHTAIRQHTQHPNITTSTSDGTLADVFAVSDTIRVCACVNAVRNGHGQMRGDIEHFVDEKFVAFVHAVLNEEKKQPILYYIAQYSQQ